MHAVIEDPSHNIMKGSEVEVLPVLSYEIEKHYLR